MEKQYFEPNRSNKNNYMLDSTAYNYIARKSEVLDIMKKSLLYGFRYYSTAVQDRELSGEGAKTYDSQCIPVRMRPMDPALLESFDLIDKELGIKVVSEVANAMKDHTRVDGTNRFISPESIEGKIYKEISSKNKKNNSTPFEYSHDAMIAEAAVHHECILVTNDGELRESINKSISDGAITIGELVTSRNMAKTIRHRAVLEKSAVALRLVEVVVLMERAVFFDLFGNSGKIFA